MLNFTNIVSLDCSFDIKPVLSLVRQYIIVNLEFGFVKTVSVRKGTAVHHVSENKFFFDNFFFFFKKSKVLPIKFNITNKKCHLESKVRFLF